MPIEKDEDILFLKKILQQIEGLESKHHIVIGAILKKDSTIKFNENHNGVMVNSMTIPMDVLKDVQKYLDYIREQEQILQKIEYKTEEYKQCFFTDNNSVL